MARAELVGAFLADTPADSLGILTAQEHRLYHDFFHTSLSARALAELEEGE